MNYTAERKVAVMKVQRIFCLLIAFVMLFVCAGCSKSDSDLISDLENQAFDKYIQGSGEYEVIKSATFKAGDSSGIFMLDYHEDENKVVMTLKNGSGTEKEIDYYVNDAGIMNGMGGYDDGEYEKIDFIDVDVKYNAAGHIEEILYICDEKELYYDYCRLEFCYNSSKENEPIRIDSFSWEGSETIKSAKSATVDRLSELFTVTETEKTTHEPFNKFENLLYVISTFMMLG